VLHGRRLRELQLHRDHHELDHRPERLQPRLVRERRRGGAD
jgi:hypothetical protein